MLNCSEDMSVRCVYVGGALTSVFSHAIASLSSEAGLDAVPGAVHVKVDGVQTLLKRVGGIYTFAGPLAGELTRLAGRNSAIHL